MSINRLNVAAHLLEYQLNIIGKTLEDAQKDDMWWANYTITPEQHAQFKKYSIKVLQKVFKFNRRKAEDTFTFFNIHFGLKIKE